MRRVIASLAALAMVTACSPGSAGSAATDAPSTETTVSTSSGTLHGRTTATAREFLGVRYAQPPTGQRRWTLPQPAPAAPGVVDATKAGPACPQATAVPGSQSSTSEDCLFLNVTTPYSRRAGEKLPVMVWWHGGGFTSGAGAEYDAQRLAARGNVIVVTVNYRLGVFGYLGLPGLAGSGDFGFADQVAGTRWAKQNAAAFGGDPDDITVFGESAGGMSACALLTSPAATGLVQRIAISSGTCGLHWPAGGLFPGLPDDTPYKPLAANEQNGLAAAKTLGCKQSDPLACLRGLPVDALVKIGERFTNQLAYGTELLPIEPVKAVQEGKIAAIPVLSGGNRDEHNSFVAGAVAADPKAITAATYPTLVRTAFGASAPKVLRRYPLTRFGSAPLAWARVVTDSAWSCPTLAGDRAMAARTRVYGYEFADPRPPNVNGSKDPAFAHSAAHATDLPYLFDLGGHNLLDGQGQHRLADTMIAYWSSFARTGVPTAPGAPAMRAMTPTSSSVTALAPGTTGPDDTSARHQCAFWQTVRR
ncbi:carboxylesterase/lipase family protein [Labedaea rhizosphaerae]|uniref:Carboxylic ester hydrolase n=1 Tax=Labedaea rhizosphaerae TaxID=598644 RepID=A0A4R6SFD0_LABRH|nr:carboxylesterase family protein [Labedaea rhizosphaerae]TDQ00702.1 para-nitrobenzyl esterase [Labedaea rhizosphaerae]